MKTEIKQEPKFNHYDFSNSFWKNEVLSFETELNNFDGGFDEFLKYKISLDVGRKYEIERELNQKINSLNYLRNLRALAAKHESDNFAEANKELGLNMVEIEKMF